MKRTNLIKAVVCAIMITLVMTSTFFAGTASSEKKVRGITYEVSYNGSAGTYIMEGDSTSVRTTAVNPETSERYFKCFVRGYNYNTASYDFDEVVGGRLNNGEALSIMEARDIDSKIHDYKHTANGYSTPVCISGAIIDEYTLDAWQYYRY